MYVRHILRKNADLQSVTRYIVKSNKIKQTWTRLDKFNICLCVNFGRYCKKLIFGGETEHLPVSLPSFEIFFSFPIFQILKSFVISWDNLYAKFIILDINFRFIVDCKNNISLIVDRKKCDDLQFWP